MGIYFFVMLNVSGTYPYFQYHISMLSLRRYRFMTWRLMSYHGTYSYSSKKRSLLMKATPLVFIPLNAQITHTVKSTPTIILKNKREYREFQICQHLYKRGGVFGHVIKRTLQLYNILVSSALLRLRLNIID